MFIAVLAMLLLLLYVFVYFHFKSVYGILNFFGAMLMADLSALSTWSFPLIPI